MQCGTDSSQRRKTCSDVPCPSNVIVPSQRRNGALKDNEHLQKAITQEGKSPPISQQCDEIFLQNKTSESAHCAHEETKSLTSAQVKSTTNCRRNVANHHADVFILPPHKEANVAPVCEQKDSHKCPLCDKLFSRKQYIKRHIVAAHEKHKPHECTQCDKRFTRKHDMRKHVAAVHEKQKPHKCTQCDKGFTRNSHMKIHIAVVHQKQKPHNCLLCDKSFLQKSNMTKHVAAVHHNKNHTSARIATTVSQPNRT